MSAARASVNRSEARLAVGLNGATDVALRDGSTVRIRPATEADRASVLRFLQRLSPSSLHLRFFCGAVDLEGAAVSATEVGVRGAYALVATRGFDGEVVAHAAYFPTGSKTAEVAFAVADPLQGHGVGTILLAHLAGVAADDGIAFFEAEVLPENHRMIQVFRESGFDVRTRSEPGLVIVDFPTEVPRRRVPASRSASESRPPRRCAPSCIRGRSR